MREFNARLIAPLLRITGYRFSKHFRWGTNFGHRVTYRLISTPIANNLADAQLAGKRIVITDRNVTIVTTPRGPIKRVRAITQNRGNS